MQLDTAFRVTRAFFAAAPACREWDGAVQRMSQCLACVAQALSSVECQWTLEFLTFVRTSISKTNVLTLLQTISNIVSEAMVAVLYFFMCICSSSAGPEWSILFMGSQSLSQSLALVAQILQAIYSSFFCNLFSICRHIYILPCNPPRSPTRPFTSLPRPTLTHSRPRNCSGCCSACPGPLESSERRLIIRFLNRSPLQCLQTS
jgi:hypothetical protein